MAAATKPTEEAKTESEAPKQSEAVAKSEISKAFDGSKNVPGEAEEGKVKYVGPASTRRVTASDWEAVGIVGAKDATWNFANEFVVPTSKFSEEQLEVLRRDPGFKIG